MPVKVQIDQAARHSTSANTSGLLLGTDQPHRRILYLLPTPASPSGVSPHRWAVEHANLVQPMCPGGLSILGSYLPLRGTTSTPTVQVQSGAAIARDIAAAHTNDTTSLVLCLASKGRVVAKIVSPDSSHLLKNADLKEVPNLTNSIVSIRTTLPIPSTMFPLISASESPRRFKSACNTAARSLASDSILQLPDSLCTIATTIDDSRVLADTMGWHTDDTLKDPVLSNHALQVHLLSSVCPTINKPDPDTETPPEHLVRLSSLYGSLHLEAVAARDATIGHALSALRVDITRSIRSRADLLVETYLPDDHEDTADKLNLPPCSVFPARVVATHDSPSLRFLSLSEYLMPGETIDEDLTSRFLETFSFDDKEFAEWNIEMREAHHAEPTEDEIKPRAIPSGAGITSMEGSPGNEVLDIQNLMQMSVIVAIVLGFAAIFIKQLLSFW